MTWKTNNSSKRRTDIRNIFLDEHHYMVLQK
jgi:hypothetical protein